LSQRNFREADQDVDNKGGEIGDVKKKKGGACYHSCLEEGRVKKKPSNPQSTKRHRREAAKVKKLVLKKVLRKKVPGDGAKTGQRFAQTKVKWSAKTAPAQGSETTRKRTDRVLLPTTSQKHEEKKQEEGKRKYRFTPEETLKRDRCSKRKEGQTLQGGMNVLMEGARLEKRPRGHMQGTGTSSYAKKEKTRVVLEEGFSATKLQFKRLSDGGKAVKKPQRTSWRESLQGQGARSLRRKGTIENVPPGEKKKDAKEGRIRLPVLYRRQKKTRCQSLWGRERVEPYLRQ